MLPCQQNPAGACKPVSHTLSNPVHDNSNPSPIQSTTHIYFFMAPQAKKGNALLLKTSCDQGSSGQNYILVSFGQKVRGYGPEMCFRDGLGLHEFNSSPLFRNLDENWRIGGNS